MEEQNLNKLIGIPFKIGGDDFTGCDCRGLCYLYHKFVHGKEYTHTDNEAIIERRDKDKDNERMHNVLKEFTMPVGFDDLREGDVVLMKSKNHAGALGICFDNMTILCTHSLNGSMRVKKESIKNNFIKGYRIV